MQDDNLIGGCEPYVGPRPFQREDQELFFGRADESNDLVSLITAHPIVLLYAQSGAGKTSLLNARVIPMLEQEEFDVLGPLRVTRELTPGFDYKEVNLYMFNALSGNVREAGDPSSLAQLPFDRYLKKIYPTSEGRLVKPCVVIFDQFEELFTFYPERWENRRGFFEQISQALEDPLLRVVLAMREDYIAELEPYEDLLPERLRTRFRLERLREEAALLAIEGPLKKGPLEESGFGFAPDVAKKLVNDLLTIPFQPITGGANPKGEYVEAVQLQVVCRALWKKLQELNEKTITRKHLKAHGDVNTALSAFYEECVTAAAKESQEKEWAIRDWFERKLITENGKRGKVFRGLQRTGGLSNVAVDRLEKLHIINAEVSGGERWYELSHDRFIQPVQKSNKDWLVERSSAVSTRKHLEEKAARGELLEESELLEAKRWLDSPVAAEMDVAKAVTGLILASEAAIAVKKAAQQREVEDARTIAKEQQRRAEAEAQRAEEQQQRAEAERLRAEEQQGRAEAERLQARAERKRVKQLRWGLTLLSFLLIVAVISTVIAVKKTIAAEKATQSEVELKEIAQRAALDAEAATVREMSQKKMALEAANVAEAARASEAEQRQIALKAASDAEKARASEARQRERADQKADDAIAALKDKATALSLADQRAGEAKAAEEREATQRKLAEQKANEAEAAQVREAKETEIAQQNEIKAVRNAQAAKAALDAIAEIDRQTPHNELTLRGVEQAETGAMVSLQGNAIFTVSKDGTAQIQNYSAGDNWSPIPLDLDPNKEDAVTTQSQINSAVLSPDGRLVATARKDSTVKISDASTGKPLTKLSGHSGPVTTVAFSHDGKLLVTASTDGTARLWDVAEGKPLRVLSAGQSSLSSAQFSPNDKFVLTISEDKTARLWNVAEGKQQAMLNEPVAKADFSPDGNFVVTVSGNKDDQIARLWEAETGTQRAELRGHSGQVNSAIFSKDPAGRYIVTASADGTARVWKSERRGLILKSGTGKTLKELREHTGLLVSYQRQKIFNILPSVGFSMVHKPAFNNITSVAFSPYQDKSGKPRYVVTGSDNGTAKFWDIETGRKITEFRGHIGPITSLDFSPDGKLVITAGSDGSVRLWNPCKGAGPTDFEGRLCRYCELIGVKNLDDSCSDFLKNP